MRKLATIKRFDSLLKYGRIGCYGSWLSGRCYQYLLCSILTFQGYLFTALAFYLVTSLLLFTRSQDVVPSGTRPHFSERLLESKGSMKEDRLPSVQGHQLTAIPLEVTYVGFN